MSLWRYFGLVFVVLWFVVAFVYALSDVDVMLDPMSRRVQHLCEADSLQPVSYAASRDLGDKECLPRLARRAGFDALMVTLPMLVGFSIATRGRTDRSRRRRVRVLAPFGGRANIH